MRPLARLLSLVACSAFGVALAGAAAAAEPNCVTVCQAKVDACGAQCEALAETVYRDPASLEQCTLGCAKGLFTSCVENCNATGEVVADDYRLAAPNPDRLPVAETPADETPAPETPAE
jgi:hypothetical protein